MPGATQDVGIAGFDMQLSKAPQAAILQFCQESRKECISIYERIFRIHFRNFNQHRRENLCKEGKYYLNPYVDNLYIAHHFCRVPYLGFRNQEQLEVSTFLRSLAVDINWFLRTDPDWSHYISNLMTIIQESESLEEVILFSNQYEYTDPRSKTPSMKNGSYLTSPCQTII
jgi:hypothetical protein